MPKIRRLSIAGKLLLWSGTLILIFFAATAFLFAQVRSDAEVADRLVTVHHQVGTAIQRMLDRLYSIRDNVLRYRLTGSPDAVQFIVADLNRFGEILDETLREHPRYAGEWSDLSREFAITLVPNAGNGDLDPDATIQEWTGILEQSLMDNQADMEIALTGLRAAGQRAADIGLYGLALCLLLGIGGSLALAWSLNRSLTEIRRGLGSLGGGGTPLAVRVRTGDELGELALAFNAMAERLRREEAMRADFIAMLSHEIRTPLTSMREAVDLIRTGAFGEVNDRQQRFLTIAQEEAVRLTDLLARLMTVSRMEAGSLELAVEPVDCAELVASALERMAPAARAAGVELAADLPEKPVRCACDREHVRQVLLNLIGNAVKFSPAGETVAVSLDADGTSALFTVRDHGPGVAEDERERIFRKYYRAREVRDGVDGAGLGLAIARSIVEAHGGRIGLENGPGKGAAFHFSIPLTGPEEAA
ncbi:MAG: ATP-binding protein [Pseudodesulfovibrio sp.]